MNGAGATEEDARISPAQPSASVILVRRATDGFEVFMVRRPASAAAFADVYVFPGGTVRQDDYLDLPADGAFTSDEALRELTTRGSTPPGSAALAIALWRAALRELFEEAGVLLARDARGQTLRIPDDSAAHFASLRRALQAGNITLAEILIGERLALDYRALRYFSHWITPVSVPRRFDTRFFIAEMPDGQTAVHYQGESTEGVWVRPGDALNRFARGQFGLVLPTRMHLDRLRQHSSLEDLMAFAARKTIRTMQPTRSGPAEHGAVVLPPEAAEW